jgi:hypothetical protein
MRRSRAHLTFLCGALLLWMAGVCFGQKANDSRPAPLDPAEGKKQARALVAELLAQTPDHNTTDTGQARIRDATGKEREVPLRFEITATPTNWASVYETLTPAGTAAGERLTVIHTPGQPNQYRLANSTEAASTNSGPRVLAPEETMIPFAGSDFWVADLGLEFLHWPQQQVLSNAMRHSKSCKVLESINPLPVAGGYARVVSWFIVESPHGLVHADAYNAKGKRIKEFDPTALEKIEGYYQLQEMEMRNLETHSHTWIKFDLTEH